MRCRKLFLVLLGFFSVLIARAQSKDQKLEEIIESITQNLTEEVDYSELVERLTYYYNRPLHLNQATSEDLQGLIFLNPLQISTLLAHRTSHGPFMDILELQALDTFDLETIQRLQYFSHVGPFNEAIEAFAVSQPNDLILRFGRNLELPRGFAVKEASRAHYIGCPNRLMVRYKFNQGKPISASVNMEKDAGEPFFASSNPHGFDFYSGNVMFKETGPMRTLIIGDYALRLGEALTMWSGFTLGKGSELQSLAKQDVGLKPYTSLNEHTFLRGIALSVNLPTFRFIPFLSYKKIDANLKNGEITSLKVDGMHRTYSEIEDKNSTSQLIYGSNFQFSRRGLNVGFTAYYTRYGHPFVAGKALYDRYDFVGSSLSNFGLNYNYTLGNTYFFGELARGGRGFAYLNGLISALSPKASLSLLHRKYQQDYYSYFNRALAEGNQAANETGFYVALNLTPNPHWEWFSYIDVFEFPWLKANADASTRGYEILAQLKWKPRKNIKYALRYKFQSKQQNDAIENAINTMVVAQSENYRLQIEGQFNERFGFKNQLEFSRFKKGDDKTYFGFLLYQDLKYTPPKSKLSGTIRAAYFNTSHDARFYVYENDVLYNFSTLQYQDKAFRYYLNGRYRIQKGLDLWMKYSVTQFLNRKTVGSGLDQIDGKSQSEIHLQLRYQF